MDSLTVYRVALCGSQGKQADCLYVLGGVQLEGRWSLWQGLYLFPVVWILLWVH